MLIRSDWSTGDTATQVESGTSMAAPHVAGAAAMVLDAHPSWSPARVRDYLVSAGTAGLVTDPGAGSPNRLLFTLAPPVRPVIRTATLPAGRIGRAYRIQLALGSNRPGMWRVTAGRLPRGLWLSASGVLSGTPRAAGTGSVTVRFTDYVPQAVARTIAIRIKRR